MLMVTEGGEEEKSEPLPDHVTQGTRWLNGGCGSLSCSDKGAAKELMPVVGAVRLIVRTDPLAHQLMYP